MKIVEGDGTTIEPACAQSLGCLCAFHAIGGSPYESCNASEHVLICGHEPSPHSEHTTGTVNLPDGREVCWACGAEWERERMKTADRIVGYLSGDKQSITTWDGSKLARVTSAVSRRVGFHRSTRYYIRATDGMGKQWHGTSQGPNMCATLRASKR